MAVKIALESFLAVLKRSNLVPEDRLQTLIDAYQRQSGRQNDARHFADWLVAQKALTPWQAEKLLQGKHKGFFLGKYRLLSLVGKGGMSTVYLAEHVVMRRLCAIKVLPTRRLQNPSYLARFHREAQAVASLDHRNIVRAYDVDHAVDGDTEIHFLVMEYVEGKGLLDLVLSCPQSRLPPVVAAEYIRQAALGLQHAHTAGLVHRDIKPGNLLIDMQGIVKVLDLGLARFFETGDENSLTVQHDERVLGTADYLAPEQAVDSHRVDSRADIYSLGCTLYLCLAGQPPFTQGSLAQRLLAHQTRQPPAVESIEPNVPSELGDIVRKMMEKDPADRYQTAADVAAALESWLKTTPKSDFDRTFAGLDRPTPAPLERRSESSRADTVRRGSRADTSSTPAIERRSRPTTNDAPAKGKSSSSKSGPRSSDATAKPQVRRNDQETTIGGPPVPPTPAPAETTDQENSDSNVPVVFESVPMLDPESIDFNSDRFAVDGPIPFDLAAEEDDPPVARRSSRKPTSPIAGAASQLQAWRSIVRDNLRARFPTRKQQARATWAAVGIGAAIVIGLLLWTLQKPAGQPVASKPVPKNEPLPNPPVPKRDLGPELKVGGEKPDFPTIGEAITYIRENRQKFPGKPTWTVNVAGGQEYAEAIRITSRGADVFPKGVVIASVGDRPAVLKPAGSGLVLELGDVEQFTLRGFVLDGEGRPSMAQFAGFLVGSRLENVEFRNITGAGLSWQDVVGLASAPVQLNGLKFFGKSPEAVAIRMGDVRQLKLDGCRFIGPLRNGIELTSSVWNADISIRHCLFHDVQTAIRFSGGRQDLQRVAIVNNTFHKAQRGLVWNDMPQAGSSRLTICHNLFVGLTQNEVEIAENFDPAVAAELLSAGNSANNWSDRPAPGENAQAGFDLFVEGRRGIEAPAFASTDPTNPGFLKPTTPSVANELKSVAPGADPIVGAIAP